MKCKACRRTAERSQCFSGAAGTGGPGWIVYYCMHKDCTHWKLPQQPRVRTINTLNERLAALGRKPMPKERLRKVGKSTMGTRSFPTAGKRARNAKGKKKANS